MNLQRKMRLVRREVKLSWLSKMTLRCRAYLSEALRNLNYSVFTAPNMETGLDILRKQGRIDLLLTDIVMLGGNGRGLATQAATLRPAGRDCSSLKRYKRGESPAEMRRVPLKAAPSVGKSQ